MSLQFTKFTIFLLLFFLLSSCSAAKELKKKDKPPIPMTCDYAKKIFTIGLSNHIDFKKISSTLEERVFKSFVYRIDPAKNLALESEISDLKKKSKKQSLFKDLENNCDKILPAFYNLSLNITKRYTQKVIEYAKKIKKKDIDNFKISKYEKKYEKRATSLKELEERIYISTLKLFKYLQATDMPFDKLKKNFIKDSEKALTQINEAFKNANGKPEDQYEKFQFFLSAFINALDAHSVYIPYSDYIQNEEEFNQGYFFGIGILIGKEKYKGIKVKEVYKNGPAGKNGVLKTGDIIYKVNGTNVIDLPLEDGVKLIKGPKGTKVKLDFLRTIKDEIKNQSVTLVRNKVFFTESIKVELVKHKGKKIAFIKLEQFFRNAANGVYKKYISTIGSQKIDGIILDLTRNGGGLLSEAIELTDHFIDRGPVVATKNSISKINIHQAKTPGELAKRVPMIVLVNKTSASASEIVSGALKDYNRAIIVGQEYTFGKGSVQDVIPILGGKMGALHITIAKFFRPGGKSTQLKGIHSDIVLPGIISEDYQGERDQLFPVSFETIPSMISKQNKYKFPYQKYMKILKKLSKERVKKSKLFAELQKDQSDIDYDMIDREQPFKKEALEILSDYFTLLDKDKKNASK